MPTEKKEEKKNLKLDGRGQTDAPKITLSNGPIFPLFVSKLDGPLGCVPIHISAYGSSASTVKFLSPAAFRFATTLDSPGFPHAYFFVNDGQVSEGGRMGRAGGRAGSCTVSGDGFVRGFVLPV